ncbi:MAG: sugar O-acetyltransferase [Lentisphaerae bacterium]|nr:sugar O-acetyltransferase [Lentisphaerota bacterium]MCP4100163.1 sugar O-acetyltransferase [Lentisphaerota bacterium]
MIKSEKEKMFAGELYTPADPQLTRERLLSLQLCNRYNKTSPDAEIMRTDILHDMFPDAGKGLLIEPPFICHYVNNIKFGKNVCINFNCTILNGVPVTIGDNVMIAPNVQFYTAHHPIEAEERIKGPEFASPITVGNKVWIGGGAIILPGVTIGNNTTIGAGSVVTKDIPPNAVAAGNPCRVIRKI